MAEVLSQYFYMNPLQQVIFNKTTGDPLAGGIVTFWTDITRTVPMDVFEYNGTDYTNLGASLTLSGIGSFVDPSGNNLQVFLWPFIIVDGVQTPHQYYIYVTDSSLSFEFDVQNWPPNNFATPTPSSASTAVSQLNQITNPQFAEVSFLPLANAAIAVTGSLTQTPIAPGWWIETSGTDTVTLTQNDLNFDAATLPPYSLSITTGTGSLTHFRLYQRIYESPRLLAASIVGGFFEATSSGSATMLTMTYKPSGSLTASTVLASMTTTGDGIYNSPETAGGFTGPVDLSLVTPVNTDAPPAGYVDISVTPSTFNTTWQITSLQVEAVASITDLPVYSEVSVPLEQSLLAWYWIPKLQYKPIPSYLVGWDFPLNPAQIFGKTVAAPASGANTGFYAWDQTIVYQSVTSAVNVAASSTGNGAITLTAAAITQMGLLQYLPVPTCRDILLHRISSMITTAASTAINGSISLWYTTNVSVPVLPLLFFSSVDATGHPIGITAGWTEIPRALGSAIFTIPLYPAMTPSGYQDIPFSGWDLNNASNAGMATYFAIFIGTASAAIGNSVGFQSVSVNSGDIPTIPAPQTPDEVLRECQYYFQKSLATGFPPANNAGLASGPTYFVQTIGAAATNAIPVRFAVPMRKTPVYPPIFYNPTSGAAGQILNFTTGASYSATSSTGMATLSANGVMIQGVSDAGSSAGNVIAINWSVNAQLGVI